MEFIGLLIYELFVINLAYKHVRQPHFEAISNTRIPEVFQYLS